MVAKCGEVRVWHWAHHIKRACDPWWENETVWHRAWKDEFPPAWQEVVERADDGERHIADVKTDRGWVLEFQHSYLHPEERRSRNAFYRQLVWVVNGRRRKTDYKQFVRVLDDGVPIDAAFQIRKLRYDEECRLLQEWGETQTPLFFDFGADESLWCRLVGRGGEVYVAPFSRGEFVGIHCHNGTPTIASSFQALIEELERRIASYEAQRRAQAHKQRALQASKSPQNPFRPRRYRL
jgi:hypothetical protein